MNIQPSIPGMAALKSIIHSRSDISPGGRARVFRAEIGREGQTAEDEQRGGGKQKSDSFSDASFTPNEFAF